VKVGHKKAQKAQNVIEAAASHLRFLCLTVTTYRGLFHLYLDLLPKETSLRVLGGGPNKPADAKPESRSQYCNGYQ
jgi:hypothetical protein